MNKIKFYYCDINTNIYCVNEDTGLVMVLSSVTHQWAPSVVKADNIYFQQFVELPAEMCIAHFSMPKF